MPAMAMPPDPGFDDGVTVQQLSRHHSHTPHHVAACLHPRSPDPLPDATVPASHQRQSSGEPDDGGTEEGCRWRNGEAGHVALPSMTAMGKEAVRTPTMATQPYAMASRTVSDMGTTPAGVTPHLNHPPCHGKCGAGTHRRADLPLLVEHAVARLNAAAIARRGRHIERVEPDMRSLLGWAWQRA